MAERRHRLLICRVDTEQTAVDKNGWWHMLPPGPAAATLTGEQRVQTAIIGGGICGLAVADRLAQLQPNAQLCLIERERIGFGASGRNAGFLLNLHSHGPPKGLEVLRRNMLLWNAGLESLRKKVTDSNIDCDWSDWGRLYAAAGKDGERRIHEIAATLDQLRLPYQSRDTNQMNQQLGTPFYTSGLHTGGNALVNPSALMRGLAKRLPASVKVFENSFVTRFEKVGSEFVIHTANGVVRANRLVLANGVHLKDFGIATARFLPMGTYASLSAPIDQTLYDQIGFTKPFGLLASSENGATIRLLPDRRLFVRNHYHFVPNDLATGVRLTQIVQSHRDAMKKRWPMLADLPFESSWGGAMAFTRNNGAVFGQFSPNLFAVLTNDVSPMTRGEAAGTLLAELMENQDSELLSAQLSFPKAARLPPRPILDIGILARRGLLQWAAGREY